MSWDIEAVKARCEAATKGPWTWKVGGTVESATFEAVCKSTTGRCHDMSFIAHARTDLPDAIELIEEAEDLLLDARPVIGGEREKDWCKRREAFFAKIRPQQPGAGRDGA